MGHRSHQETALFFLTYGRCRAPLLSRAPCVAALRIPCLCDGRTAPLGLRTILGAHASARFDHPLWWSCAAQQQFPMSSACLALGSALLTVPPWTEPCRC